jgi:phosphate:Na+ symporter
MADRVISVAYPVLDAAGELPARQNAESDFAALPAPAAHCTTR